MMAFESVSHWLLPALSAIFKHGTLGCPAPRINSVRFSPSFAHRGVQC
jgi:hypothetical protein